MKLKLLYFLSPMCKSFFMPLSTSGMRSKPVKWNNYIHILKVNQNSFCYLPSASTWFAHGRMPWLCVCSSAGNLIHLHMFCWGCELLLQQYLIYFIPWFSVFIPLQFHTAPTPWASCRHRICAMAVVSSSSGIFSGLTKFHLNPSIICL